MFHEHQRRVLRAPFAERLVQLREANRHGRSGASARSRRRRSTGHASSRAAIRSRRRDTSLRLRAQRVADAAPVDRGIDAHHRDLRRGGACCSIARNPRPLACGFDARPRRTRAAAPGSRRTRRWRRRCRTIGEAGRGSPRTRRRHPFGAGERSRHASTASAQPRRRASQDRAMTPCAPWKARNVGRPGGSGISAPRVSMPANPAMNASTASASTPRLHGCARHADLRVGAALHGDARQHGDEVEPAGTDRGPRPVDEVHARVGQQHVVGAHVEVQQAVAGRRPPAIGARGRRARPGGPATAAGHARAGARLPARSRHCIKVGPNSSPGGLDRERRRRQRVREVDERAEHTIEVGRAPGQRGVCARRCTRTRAQPNRRRRSTTRAAGTRARAGAPPRCGPRGGGCRWSSGSPRPGRA